MTIFTCGILSLALFTMLYLACTDDKWWVAAGTKDLKRKCHFEKGNYQFPMVSDVICLERFDRVWCILSTLCALTCMQVNIRAAYKHLWDSGACKGWNDACVIIGTVLCISFPLIGYFDEHVYKSLHGFFATLFFSSTCFYANILAHELWEHRDRIPENLHGRIEILWWVGWIMCGILVIFGLSFQLPHFGPMAYSPPFWEWALAFLYINYYTLASLMNPYYDSIHPLNEETMN